MSQGYVANGKSRPNMDPDKSGRLGKDTKIMHEEFDEPFCMDLFRGRKEKGRKNFNRDGKIFIHDTTPTQ